MKAYFLLFLFVFFPALAIDYETGLRHSGRWFFKEILTLPTDQPIVLGLDFYTVEKKHAEACAQRLQGELLVLETPLLKYNYKVTVLYKFQNRNEINEQWLREQYYLGVAYYCDWSGGGNIIE